MLISTASRNVSRGAYRLNGVIAANRTARADVMEQIADLDADVVVMDAGEVIAADDAFLARIEREQEEAAEDADAYWAKRMEKFNEWMEYQEELRQNAYHDVAYHIFGADQ